ncbi:PQQ-binding-like beta-propeller repeat protein [bacterium]|nr:PQQ-binding-like beta-propeller repeat protein [bacterium]
MNRNKWTLILLSIAFMANIFSCQKSLLKGISSNDIEGIWYWCGDTQRSGLSSEEMTPPLKLLWTHKAHAALGQAITASDSFLVFGTKDGWVTILALDKGEKIREIKIKKKVSITCLFDKNLLFVAQHWDNLTLRAFDFDTGKTVWEKNKGSIISEPLIDGNRLICGNEEGQIFVLNTLSGEDLWEKDIGESISGYALNSDSTLIVATDEGTVYAFSSFDGILMWKQNLSGSIAANPVLSDELLFIGTQEGNFYCLSIHNGSVLWQYKDKGGIYLTAATDKTNIYFGTTQGIIYCLDAYSGKEKWRFETDSVIGTSPLVSGRWIYFGTLDKMCYGISRETGEEKWKFEARGRIRTSPLIWNGMLIIASEDRYVYGFKEENPF